MTKASGSQPVRVRYVMDEATYMDASRALWEWGRRQTRIKVRSWLLLAALPLTGFLALRYGMWFTFFAVIALAALHFVFDWPLTRAFARRGFAQLPVANAPVEWRIDESGLQVRLGEGEAAQEARIAWQALTEVSRHDTGFVLHQPHNVHHWLPKKGFAGAADVRRFEQLLARHRPGGHEQGGGGQER